MGWDVEDIKKTAFLKNRCPHEDEVFIECLVENEDVDNMSEAAKSWYAVIDGDYQHFIVGARTKEALVKELLDDELDDSIQSIYHDGVRLEWELTIDIKEPAVAEDITNRKSGTTNACVITESKIETPKPKHDNSPFGELF